MSQDFSIFEAKDFELQGGGTLPTAQPAFESTVGEALRSQKGYRGHSNSPGFGTGSFPKRTATGVRPSSEPRLGARLNSLGMMAPRHE